jgi:NAD(P)-dependent dehydrogenase (short-subunit alcohol dehydrogenase family)
MTATPVPAPIADLVSLQGRVAAITGAAMGIGAAIAHRFSEAGADLLLIDRNQAALTQTASVLPGTGRVECLNIDITDVDTLRTQAGAALDRLGGVDIWVNNAGIAPRRGVLDITPQEWDEVMSVNLGAALTGAQIAARAMIAADRPGVILNIVSSSVHRMSANPAHYRASKAGLAALTQNLAVELGRNGIRVVAIAPGLTATPMVASLREDGLGDGLDEFVRRLPLRRIGLPDDIGRVALFAASDLASFVTGCVLDVDGGEAQK